MTTRSIHDIARIDEWGRSLRIDPYQLRRFRLQFYKRGAAVSKALKEIQALSRTHFADEIEFHPLEIVEQLESNSDGAVRIIFRLRRSQQLIETVVLRHEKGRTTLCVSCQVGCAAGCGFCATGSMGLQGNLTGAEILDQVIQANQILRPEDRRIRNVVFMGMGEPFHNEEVVAEAIEVLQSPRCFDLEPARILVSTVGISEAMIRFAKRFPAVGLALSLHSALEETRRSIIPLANRYSLTLLREALQQIGVRRKRGVMIEYLMLDGINDSPEDAAALIHFLEGLTAHINLIPYNPIESGPAWTASSAKVIDEFAERLRGAGFTTTIRHSLGTDIAAACGQLIHARIVKEQVH